MATDTDKQQTKTSNKRLSIEGAKAAATSAPRVHFVNAQPSAMSPPVDQSPTPRANPPQAEDAYVARHVDVTEEVNRRLQESRLRRLMQTPSTAQKRKYNSYEEEPKSEGPAGTDEGPKSGYSGSEYERTPTKRLKSSGTFEQLGKRKENGNGNGNGNMRTEATSDGRANFKRRKFQ
jgi:hypothetical protein